MKKARELHLLEMSKEPWQEISINIIGLLPESNGKNVIVVIVDWFTKIIWLKMTTINVLSEEIAKNLSRQNLENTWSSMEGS